MTRHSLTAFHLIHRRGCCQHTAQSQVRGGVYCGVLLSSLHLNSYPSCSEVIFEEVLGSHKTGQHVSIQPTIYPCPFMSPLKTTSLFNMSMSLFQLCIHIHLLNTTFLPSIHWRTLRIFHICLQRILPTWTWVCSISLASRFHFFY